MSNALSIINGLFFIITGILVILIRKNYENKEAEKEADSVTDRLLKLQRDEREILVRELEKKNQDVGRLTAENVSLQEKLDILTDAIHYGTKEYRRSVVKAVGYQNGDTEDENESGHF